VKPEQKLYHLFKKNLNKETLITRLEVYSAHGVSDLLLYNDAGFCMVELKIQRGKKIFFSPHQVLFHTTRNKRNFILVEGPDGPRSSIKLYGSNNINQLILNPDTAPPLAVNDWELINNIILNKKKH
jgi:hypothetical protein